ncbi:MAG: hypothetical protein ACTJFN_12070 [Sphingobacterium sp.]
MQLISRYVQLKKGTVLLNGQTYLEGLSTDFKVFSKELYQQLGIHYPKFYKMDNLSKLAFLASEIILSDNTEKEVALIFSNKEASLDTDIQHQKRIQEPQHFFPSPAVFVYTLPSICIGEVSIRHQFKSESMFFLSDCFQVDYIMSYSSFLINSGKAKKVLFGRLRMLKDDFFAHLYLVEIKGTLEHSKKNIEKIINSG